MILHCIKSSLWEERKALPVWGEKELLSEGFIHCSTVEYFWRVAPNFKAEKEKLLLLCIDEEKLTAEVRYEDGDGVGRAYPHIYGLVNNDAVSVVLPFLRDENGDWLKNPELKDIPDR